MAFQWIRRAALSFALLVATQGMAISPGDAIGNFFVRGNIPVIFTPITLGGLGAGGVTDPYGTIEDTDFLNGYVDAESGNEIVLSNINTNVPMTIQVQNKGWTLPTGYDTVSGPKKADGSDSDLLLFVNPGDATSLLGSISVLGNYGTEFTAVTNVSSDVIRIGSAAGAPFRTGILGGGAKLTPRMNLNPVYDIPGEYIVEVELTVSFTP